MLRKISTWLDAEPSSPSQNPAYRRCDYQGCDQEGLYKAPKEPVAFTVPSQSWYWFCKHHVRVYNAEWNYYKGMNEDQAYDSYRKDVTWNRQSWPIHQTPPHQMPFQDPFGFIDHNQTTYYLTPEEQEALKTLTMNFPFSAEDLQIAYREHVKKNHPDIHKTTDAQENIIKINHAHHVLKKVLSRINYA